VGTSVRVPAWVLCLDLRLVSKEGPTADNALTLGVLLRHVFTAFGLRLHSDTIGDREV
jgi:hypothetical protein